MPSYFAIQLTLLILGICAIILAVVIGLKYELNMEASLLSLFGAFLCASSALISIVTRV